MWADPVAFFQTLRRRLEAFTAPPLLPEDFVNTRELQPQISGCCGIHHKSAEWGSASPQIPRPRSQDRLPFLPSLSLGSVKLSSFEEEYLAHSLYTQGVSDSRCLLSHQLAMIQTPRAALHPQTWAEGDVQCVNSRNMAERSWQWGIVHLLWLVRPKRFKTCSEIREKNPQGIGNARQTWGKGREKDFWLVYNPQLNDWQNGFVHLNHPLWTLSFAN